MSSILRNTSVRLTAITFSIALTLYLLGSASVSPPGDMSSGTWGLLGSWTYIFARDANYNGLSEEQCGIAFPGFYGDIDSAVSFRKGSPVQLHELKIQDDHCLLRVMIFNAEVFIIQGSINKGCWIKRWHERTSGFLHSIHQAVVSAPPGTVPNVEFVLDLDDDAQRPIDLMHGSGSNKTTVWGLTKLDHQRNIWLVPDYAYWAWPSALVPSHTQVRRKMMESNVNYPWSKKISKVIWRGTTHLNPKIRETLLGVVGDKSWGDVKVCDIYMPDTKQYCITQDQHCQYKFPIHTEGFTYSGRLKYLQLCNSAPIVHELKWIEHHHRLMRSNGSNQNFIQVKNDWSDLEEKVLYYLEHEDQAIAIARNSYQTFYERYLTPAATSCYWRRLFVAWASVQGFEPQLYEKDEKTGQTVLRGTPFEAYALDAEHPMPDV